MRKTFFTVGPSQIHPSVAEFLKDAFEEDISSISHRSTAFSSLYERTVASLRRLLRIPDGSHVFFLGSATEAMERIIENCVEERSFHLVNGAFSRRFFNTAVELKKRPEMIEVNAGEGFDLPTLTIPREAELLALVHNETSTGAAIRMDELHALKKRYPNVLFALDIVSSAPYVDVDYSLVDCAFFSVQKGFGMPAGLGVLVVNERCIEKADALAGKGLNIGTYHSFPRLLKYEQKHQTPETPNVLGIYLLGRIADAYHEHGIERIRKETDEKAARLYDFFENQALFAPVVKNPPWRSQTVIAIETPGGSRPVIEKTAQKGFIIGSGYGEYRDKHIRIGNFPSHTLKDVDALLDVLE